MKLLTTILLTLALSTSAFGGAGVPPTLPPPGLPYTVGVTPPVVARFTGLLTTGAAPHTVCFTDQSTGTATAWAWTFGDGGTSTLQDPCHTYTVPGVYTVSLNVTCDEGNDDKVIPDYITVTGYPYISGVTDVNGGSIANGDVLTIAGTSFGTNDVSKDFFDGFESGAFQSPWSLTDGGYSQGFSTVVAAGANARHAASSYVLKTSFPSISGNAHQCIYRDPFTTLYAQYWVKLDNNFDFGGPGSSGGYGPTELANVKFFRLWPYGSSQEDFVTAFHKYFSTNEAIVVVENIEPYPNTWYAWNGFANPDQFTKDTWHLFQFEYKSSSGLGVADGVFKWTVDGSVKISKTNIVTMKNTNTPKDEVWLGFGDTTSGWNYDGANDAYFDDIYITPTFARVEIGNASTYAASTQREIQVPTAWANGSVSVTANKGSFASLSGKYLYVIDSTGRASIGYLIP